MRVHKAGLVAILTAGGLLAFNSILTAQDTNQAAPPPQRPRMGGPGMGFSVDERLARLSEQLNLTEEQKPKVKAALEEQNKQMAAARDLPQEERRTKMQTARDEMTKKMKEILTEEQFKKYEALPRGRGPGQGAPGEGRRERPPAAGTNAPATNP